MLHHHHQVAMRMKIVGVTSARNWRQYTKDVTAGSGKVIRLTTLLKEMERDQHCFLFMDLGRPLVTGASTTSFFILHYIRYTCTFYFFELKILKLQNAFWKRESKGCRTCAHIHATTEHYMSTVFTITGHAMLSASTQCAAGLAPGAFISAMYLESFGTLMIKQIMFF